MIGGSSPGRGWEFLLHYRVQTGSGAHPGALSLGAKAAACEADYASPSSAAVLS